MRLQENYHASTTSLDNFFNNPQAKQIFQAYGPTLESINQTCRCLPSISALTCSDFINKLQLTPNKQLKFAGIGKQALLNGLSFILMAIASKQIKYYPHLLTLIKQQFFKPGIFADYQPQKRNRVLNICRNIQIELISAGNVCVFFQNNQQFLNGFQHILTKIIPSHIFSTNDIVEILRKKFNIDCGKIQIPNSIAECWVLGMQKKIYLIQQNSYYFIAIASTFTQPNKNMSQSVIQNRIESQRQFSDVGQQVIIEASQQSTPKFKQNQQSIRYRKKSHKNSFGGDFQITGYKQLANLIHKSQAGGDNNIQYKQNQRINKVLSLKFQMHEIGGLTEEGDDFHPKQAQNISQVDLKNQQDFTNLKNQNSKMRGSNIQNKQREQRYSRKKQITSSQIFQLRSNNVRNIDSQIPKFEEQNTNANRNNTSGKGQNKNVNQTQIKTNENLRGYNNQNLTLAPAYGIYKQNFKFSFSKKDQSRFVFKQIQSQFDEIQTVNHQYEFPLEHLPSNNKIIQQPMKSSLTNLKNDNCTTLLYQGEYLKKRENTRRSLLLDTPIVPIQQQVQSSQQQRTQEQSIPQSQRQRQRQFQNIERQQQHQKNNQIQIKGNHGFYWGSVRFDDPYENNSKNIINVLKSKNRKFSYLTQPISVTKNSLFGGNGGKNQLRQSYIDQSNQNIVDDPSKQNINPPNYIQRAYRNKKNKKSGKQPKFHKNSQAITQSKSNNRRFQQNSISFSQMIANRQESNFSGHSQKNVNKRQPKIQFHSNVIEFCKNNLLCYNQPADWIRKEVIYYFVQVNQQSENKGYLKKTYRKPERYIVQRIKTPVQVQVQNEINMKKKQNSLSKQKLCVQVNEKLSINDQKNLVKQERERPNIQRTISQTQSSVSQKKLAQQSNKFNKTQVSKRFAQIINPINNNVRSTLDTQINKQYKIPTNFYDNRNITISNGRINISSPPAFIHNNILQNSQRDHPQKRGEIRIQPNPYTNVSIKQTQNNKNIFNNQIIGPNNHNYGRQQLDNNYSSKIHIEKLNSFIHFQKQVKNDSNFTHPSTLPSFYPLSPSNNPIITPSYSISTLINSQQNKHINYNLMPQAQKNLKQKNKQGEVSNVSNNNPSHNQIKPQQHYNTNISYNPQPNLVKFSHVQNINRSLNYPKLKNQVSPKNYTHQNHPQIYNYNSENILPNNFKIFNQKTMNLMTSKTYSNSINSFNNLYPTLNCQPSNLVRNPTSPSSSTLMITSFTSENTHSNIPHATSYIPWQQIMNRKEPIFKDY